MGKVKHFIKDGKIIRETKTGSIIQLVELNEEEFKAHIKRQNRRIWVWYAVILATLIGIISVGLYQFDQLD